jgi:hypothetical protein
MAPTKKAIGYFTNVIAKLNDYVERENKTGSDVPRFTKAQVRLIVRYLERKEIFQFGHSIDCDGGKACSCREKQKEEFIRTVSVLNRRIPRAVLEMLI